MKVIIVNRREQTRTLHVSGLTRALLSFCLIGIPACLGFAGYQLAHKSDDSVINEETFKDWNSRIDEQQEELDEASDMVEDQLDAMAVRVAELQARLLRLEALGERVTDAAKLDSGEFDFSTVPAVGGPEAAEGTSGYSVPDFVGTLDKLADRLESREQQLDILETMLANRSIEDAGFLAGRPIKRGWMSSRFGYRTDPFHGRRQWHGGVDFAGKLGSDVIAVASGVVTWSGELDGYGQMIEVNHGNGYITRYAHNKENLIDVGEVVKKGQVIAAMGTSGRSTGPHVHFEVFKHGRRVDPATYIHRTNR